MLITALIIVNVFSALAIIVLVLMQQSKSDMGSAFGGGSSQSMFGSRGSANFLSRTTSIVCVVFFLSSLLLAYQYAQRQEQASVVDQSGILDEAVAPEATQTETNVPAIPQTEQVPAAPVSKETIETQDVPAVPEQN